MEDGFVTASVQQAVRILNVTVAVPQYKSAHQFRALELKCWLLGQQQLGEAPMVGINLIGRQLA